MTSSPGSVHVSRPSEPGPAELSRHRREASRAVRPRPFAIGIVGLPANPVVDHREERLQIALTTHALGYFLLDVFEVRPGDTSGYDHAEELARRTDADAFVVRGELDHGLLTSMADRIRMRIRFSCP